MRKIAALLTFTVMTFAGLAPAEARGPSPHEPASVPLSGHEAREAARYLLGELISFYPRPRGGRVSACTGGPFLWRCPIRYYGVGIRCTGTMAVWSDVTTYWGEVWNPKCETRA